MSKLIILDAGHGSNTAGKRSPDGRLLECEYARKIKALLASKLKADGYSVYDVCPESYDVSLTTRIRRANSEVKRYPGGLLVSIHSNASGSDGKWHEGKGWEVLVALNASSNSMRLAMCLAECAQEAGMKVRKHTPTQPFKKQNLGICRDTTMPAVLVESFFHDNKDEVDFALSDEGVKTYTEILYKGIKKYL